jgi:MFS family permease
MGGPDPAPVPAAVEVTEAEAKRTVNTFAAVSFLHDAGSDMVFPVWPLFLKEVLRADMAVIGLVDGLGDAMVSLSSAAAGYVSDRVRRRKVFIWPGYIMGGAARVGYAVSVTWQQVVPFKVLDRAGKIRSAPKDAIVADISNRSNRGRRFGFLRAMDNLGAVVGIVFAIAFVWAFSATASTYRTLFMIAAIPSFVGALVVVLMIKERPAGGIKVFKGLRLKDLGRDYRLFLLLSAIFAVSNFSYSFFLLFASAHHFQDAFVPVLYLTFTAVAALVSIPSGRLADTWGRKRVMTLSLLLWAGVAVVVLADQGIVAIVVAFVLYGAHKGALEPVQRAFVSELTPSDFRSSGLGAYQMVVGLCALPASLIAGFLWDVVGAWAIFAFALAFTLVAVGMLQFVREAEHGPAGAG